MKNNKNKFPGVRPSLMDDITVTIPKHDDIRYQHAKYEYEKIFGPMDNPRCNKKYKEKMNVRSKDVFSTLVEEWKKENR